MEGSDTDERHGSFKIPAFAWPAVVVLPFIGVGAISYWALSKHEHVSEGRYVGAKVCAECHPDEAASWETTRMARSFEVLRRGAKAAEKRMAGLDPDADYTHDASCLPCHTTGYGRVGGFVSIEKTPEMAGVGCEECHGPGGMYAKTTMSSADPTFKTSEARKAGLIYPPRARVCRKCHNEDSPFVGKGYKFDYTERVERGTHQHFQLKYEH